MSYLGQIIQITTPSDTSGAYLHGFQVHFRSKDPSLGVIGFISKVTSGFPDMSQILDSVYIPNSIILTSNDGSVATNIIFRRPVYVSSNERYALVIQAEGNSPNFELWTCEIGGIDQISGTQVFSNPLNGNLVESSDGYTWKSYQNEDMKFYLYRLRFLQSSGTAVFQHENDEYLTVDGFTRANSDVGLQVGDTVLAVNATSNTVMTANTDPFGIIQNVDEATGELTLDLSTGGFSTNTTLQIHRLSNYANLQLVTSNTLIATSTVTEVRNIPVHAVVPKFVTFQPARTNVGVSYKATNNVAGPFVLDSNGTTVINNEEFEFLDYSRYILSKSNEDTDLSGSPSSSFTITLQTENNFVAPVIDLMRGKSSLVVENLINNDDTDEHTRYGNALSKYISRNVVLADGQEAEDLVTYVTAYRPVDTDIKVYAKFYNATDPEPFDNKVWTELEYEEGSDLQFSSPLNTSDFLEYRFNVPSTPPVTYGAYLDPSDGILRYQNTANTTFVGYKIFSLKIVLLSSNPIRVPRLDDVRSLALQV